MLDPKLEWPTQGAREPADRMRRKLVDAFIAIVQETKRLPTAVEVSRRAQCSLRTLFERFGSMQALGVAAFDRAMAGHDPMTAHADCELEASRAHRIRLAAEGRATSTEACLALWRLAFQHDYVPALRERMDRIEERWRLAFHRLFRRELECVPPESVKSLLIALEAITHPRVWSRLREDDRVSLEEGLRLWIEAVDRLLPCLDQTPAPRTRH